MRKKWKVFVRAVCYTAGDMPAIWPLTVLTAALEAVMPYIQIFLSAAILSELTGASRDMQHLFFLAVLMTGLEFLGSALLQFCNQALDLQQYILMQHLDRAVAEKAWRMDYKLLCDPKIHGQKKTINNWQYEDGMVAMITQFRNLFRALVTIGISAALTIEFFAARAEDGGMARFLNHWSFPGVFLLLFALVTVYNIWSASGIQKGTYRVTKETEGSSNQRTELMKSCCAQYQQGKDVRIFHEQRILARKFESLNDTIAHLWEKAGASFRRLSVTSVLLSRLFHLFVYAAVGLKAVFRAFDVGNLLKYTGMVTQLGDGVTLLFHAIRDMVQNIRYLEDYFSYQETPNRTADAVLPVTQEIRDNYEFEFRHVTFTYPGAAAPSLSDVSCRFRKGEKIAVVGRNGSGKTTFIKLLCRLYDPQEGQILLNGTDIREYRYEEYLQLFSTVFQDYRIFAFTLGENVAAESEYDREKAVRALENAGFASRLRTLKDGLDTQLFKNFSEDGVELSGGESQKAAIARCLYKDAPHAVMDEPTAALDPVAEADIYQRMNRFIQGKGAVYISHRLSSCHFCSRILVFEGGRLEEQGTHEELLEKHGLYDRLWHAQAQYYRSA